MFARPTALVLLALLPVACGSPKIDVPVAEQTGAQLFISQGCVQCHAKDGSGSFLGLGPDLRDKGAFWDAGSLAEYLLDPAAFAAKTERLGAKEMPAYDMLDLAARTRIGEHVLTIMNGN